MWAPYCLSLDPGGFQRDSDDYWALYCPLYGHYNCETLLENVDTLRDVGGVYSNA